MVSKLDALRLASGIVIGLVTLAGAENTFVEAQLLCDQNYVPTPNGCVLSDRDYDCPELHLMGIGDILVIGTDWQRLDGLFDYERGYWISYPDGVGCEWYGD
jgi:hypothetical protein